MDVEYKLQIYPSYEVSAHTKKFKKMLFNRVGEYQYLHSQPHISLLYFITDSIWEQDLVNVVKETVEDFSGFTVQLKGFSYFPSGTLHIEVLQQGYMQMLARRLRQGIRELANKRKMELGSLTTVTDMHMTVGGGLSARSLAAGHSLLSKLNYEASFEVNSIKLLSNSGGGTGNSLVSEFNFGGGLHPGGPQFRSRVASTVASSLSGLYTAGSSQQLSLF